VGALDVVVVGDSNIFSSSLNFDSSPRRNCLVQGSDGSNNGGFNQNNLDLVTQVVDWTGTGFDGSCQDLDTTGGVLFDTGKSGFGVSGNFGMLFQNNWASPLATLLGAMPSINGVTVNPSEGEMGNLSLENLLTANQYKTVVIVVPDRINDGTNPVPTNSVAPYTCEDIEALRAFILEGGRLMFVGEGVVVVRANAEITRILGVLGSSISITTGNVDSSGVNPGTIAAMSSIHQVANAMDTDFCVAVGSAVNAGTTDVPIASYQGSLIQPYSIVAGNIDRSMGPQTCP
jgi:hypothetical protein